MRLPRFIANKELLIRYMNPHRSMVAVLVTLLLTFVGLEITGPLIIRHFVDSAVAGKPIAVLMI